MVRVHAARIPERQEHFFSTSGPCRKSTPLSLGSTLSTEPRRGPSPVGVGSRAAAAEALHPTCQEDTPRLTPRRWATVLEQDARATSEQSEPL